MADSAAADPALAAMDEFNRRSQVFFPVAVWLEVSFNLFLFMTMHS